MPSPALIPTLIRETVGRHSLRREPEPAIMEGIEQVREYVEGGHDSGVMATAYLFHTARICQAIAGCERVLDLGCGPATQLLPIAELNPRTFFLGLDLSQTMLDAARVGAERIRSENVEFRNDDITVLGSLDNNSVDGIISTMALHHLPTRQHLSACLEQIDRVLQPGGALYLVDFGLLKSPKSIMYFVNENRAYQPELFSRDFEMSLKAAFLPEELRTLSRRFTSRNVQFYSTFQIPLLNIIKTPDRPLPFELYQCFRAMRATLSPRDRRQLDDMRLFFWLGGLKNDPFRKRNARNLQGSEKSVGVPVGKGQSMKP